MTTKYWIAKCVKFNLEGITEENGYTFDIGLVDLTQQAIHTISPTPAIIVVPTGLTRGYLPGKVIEYTLSYALVPVVRLADLAGATDIVQVLDAFEFDINKRHHADFFLRNAFLTNPDPEFPEEKREFHLRNHKIGPTEYAYTKERGNAKIEISAEYEIVGQEAI